MGSLLLPILCLCASLATEEGTRLGGLVVDLTGAPLDGATVTVEGPRRQTLTTAADGSFTLDGIGAGTYVVTAEAAGFVPVRRTVIVSDRAGPPPPLRLILLPRPVTDAIVVTASRGFARESDQAAPVSLLSASDLALAASTALDDALRVTPGFSLFRRTSSRAANPTTQGATLRGLAASGASRALVLADGVPLNDPFGGWVYWNRVPQAAVDRVEVVRGGASDLYGADALGGVVQVITVAPARSAARAWLDGDTQGTARLSSFGAVKRDAWDLTATGEASRTTGFFVLDEATRGAVDRRAGGNYVTARLGGAFQHRGWRTRARATGFGESRRNGTAAQENDTSHRQLAGEVTGPAGGGFLEASALAGDQVYHQTFTAVAADRTTETLTSRQSVDASIVGGAVIYRLPLRRADLLGGVDVREIRATNQDTAYLPSGAIRSVTETPGFERTTGVYAQVRTPIGTRLAVIAGARADRWLSARGGDAVAVTSPRVAASFRLSPAVTLRASAGRAFRPPTPNERIRPFRVGNVLTLANAELVPETVTIGEAGAVVQAARGSLRVTGFTSRVDEAVTNVTLTTTPQLVTRQRRNASAVRASGVEAEGDWRLRSSLWATGSLALTRSRYDDTPGLTGNDVPQVPRWQTTIGARWQAPRQLTVQGVVRAFADQYEDDRNTLVLRSAALVDLSASWPAARQASVVAAVENVFNVDYDTGRTPLRTIGTPLTVRVGVRLTY